MFWVLLLCHFVADYPLQTDGMVVAKKEWRGLCMHVSIHLAVMVVVLCGIMKYGLLEGLILALAVTAFHFGIDYWKNVLTRLKPFWVIFGYSQDQVLHLASIYFVASLWQQATGGEAFTGVDPSVIYATGFVLAGHVWFVTERVFSHKRPDYQKWVGSSMWSRMMSRVMFYGLTVSGLSVLSLAVLGGAIVVGWNDLEPKIRARVYAFDFGGVMLLMGLTWLILR